MASSIPLPVADGATPPALAVALGNHLPPRLGAVLDDPTPAGRALRAAYVLAAIHDATRCPLCGPTIAGLGRG